ncbi:2333_t:CDS:1 [Funneliformis geosporum]|uniref:2333_t:CDS:1 n=1 Tax=Funneliformis geosporum TaxID=1117311 RepID=A0A9W4SX77_9GLOM|nr:2333_t:CDS:1 [Funneliformis geosporum]
MPNVQFLSPQRLQRRTNAETCTENLSSLLNDSDAMSSNQIYKDSKIQSSVIPTPIVPSSKRSKEQNDMIQRATESQFMVQHVPEQSRSSLFPHQQSTSSSSNEMEQVVPIHPKVKGSRMDFDHIVNESNESNANMNTDTDNPPLNYYENQIRQISLERQSQIDLVPTQYDYDDIKYIADQSMFNSDMSVPSYFSNMYDFAHQDDVINVGIDAEEFFTFT